jgi:multisubunit Na+/H+ antiporter MnhB subunit
MSPSKSRQQFVPSRPRAEVFTAVAVAVGIIVTTALLIWLIRPGTAGVPGRGGLFSRQPRATILFLATLGALGAVIAYVTRRRKSFRLGTRGAIGVGAAGVVVLALAAMIFWPGGIVRHWPRQPKVTTPLTPTSAPPATTAPPTTAAVPTSATPTTKAR